MALSTVHRESLQNWKRGTTFPAAPASIYCSLHSADPGLTGANEIGTGLGYARQLFTLTAPADFGADELCENVATITFGAALGVGWTATHFGVWTAVTGPTFIEGGAIAAPTAIVAGGYQRLDPGALDLTVR